MRMGSRARRRRRSDALNTVHAVDEGCGFPLLVAQPQLHGEVVFAVFEGAHCAMLADGSAMDSHESEVRGSDEDGGQTEMGKAFLDPRLEENRHPYNKGKK